MIIDDFIRPVLIGESDEDCPQCDRPLLAYDSERKRFWRRDIISCRYKREDTAGDG